MRDRENDGTRLTEAEKRPQVKGLLGSPEAGGSKEQNDPQRLWRT